VTIEHLLTHTSGIGDYLDEDVDLDLDLDADLMPARGTGEGDRFRRRCADLGAAARRRCHRTDGSIVFVAWNTHEPSSSAAGWPD
jgi:CubicO group peptidase (beta-lactamase class C family)